MKSKIQKMLYLLALVNRYVGMTATDVTCMYIQYVLHVCTSVVSIHSGVGIKS